MKILFTPHAWDKIHLYIEHTPTEVSGLGAATFDGENIIINDIGIWKQECQAAETEVVDHNSVISLAQEMMDRGHSMEELCVWWHSHAHLSSFFSSTDDTCIQNWINNKYLVSVVGNKKGEYKGRIDIKAPLPCTINPIPVELYVPNTITPELVTTIKNEITDKVTLRPYQTITTTPSYTHYPSYKSSKKSKKSNKAKDHVEILTFANWCRCDECEEIIEGTLRHFPYSTHFYDATNQMWTPTNLEQRQLAETRRYELSDDLDFETMVEKEQQNELALSRL